MAKRKLTIPLALVGGLAAGVAEPITKIFAGDLEGGFNAMSRNYTGFNPRTGTWDIANLSRGLLPLLIGGIVHKFVGGAPLNVNRSLAAAGVPFIRI